MVTPERDSWLLGCCCSSILWLHRFSFYILIFACLNAHGDSVHLRGLQSEHSQAGHASFLARLLN